MGKKYAVKGIIIGIIIIAIIIILKQTHLIKLFMNGQESIVQLKNYLVSFGEGTLFILLLIYALKPFLVISPISVMAIVTGLIYGPIYGTIYTILGSFLSATTGFFIARFLGQSFVDKISRGRGAKIDGDIEKHGLSIMLFLRLAFIFPYDPLSYAAGLTTMKYRQFIIGTVLGVIPEMFAYNYLGTSLDDLFSTKALVAVIIILGFAGTSFFIRKRKGKHKEE